ncbi:MAG TPA: hypothetical protein VMD92_04875 [Acidobacteriaceae bacterium]|nr:hypothetical protein [Acidobacteriaceae bacterium]
MITAKTAVALLAGSLSVLIGGCGSNGGNTTPPPQTYTLTVDSSNPNSGVSITVGNPNNNVVSQGTTPFTETADAGTQYILTAAKTAGANTFSAWTGCTSTTTVTCNVTLNSNMTVTATYSTPAPVAPTVTVTAPSSIVAGAAFSVTVAVAGPSGDPTPTGSVTLSSGTFSSSAGTLTNGTVTIDVPANTWTAGAGTYTLTATYTPDANSSSTYASATGTAQVTITAAAATTVTVDQSSPGPAVTDQILGMNMAVWFDPTAGGASPSPVVDAFTATGVKAVRWPGGSESDDYDWQNNSACDGGYTTPNANFSDFVSGFVQPAGVDVALTADYGSNADCDGPGVPSEAAAWLTAALGDGITVSHMTVGNEEYGSWEEDMHTPASDQHNPSVYAGEMTGSTGFYQTLKAASPQTLVGIDVDADNTSGGWDQTVMANAKGSYDFVEYHYYPEAPNPTAGGQPPSDQFLVHDAAPGLTTSINTIKQELQNYGTPNTPIYVGEIGSTYSDPGTQSLSITQALYAGQVLGEAMNDGVSRLTWWIAFGGCNDAASDPNSYFSSTLYGWQDFGGYMLFSDGLPEDGCESGDGITIPTVAEGTPFPTARAFQLFSNVAVNGESVLTATVSGADTTDVRAYAATHSGGTALVLFNLNETTSEAVQITLSTSNSTADMKVITYDKAMYDQTQNSSATANWLSTATVQIPSTTDLGPQSLPYTLTLTPWSMNVIILQ